MQTKRTKKFVASSLAEKKPIIYSIPAEEKRKIIPIST
jgi:hypothetical protein